MKKSTLLLFALITVFMLSSCEIYSLVKDLTDKEEGRITTTDGKVLTGRVEMPNANTKKLTIVTVDSQKTVLNCEDIKELVETVPYGIFMTSNSKRAARDRFREYLSDDPVLCKKLQDAEIKPLEYETIAQEYNPNR